MSLSDISTPPPSTDERLSTESLPALTRLLYRWGVRIINRTLARFPLLQHGIERLEEAETTIRRLRRERDEALGYLRERNQELAHYDTAARNLFSAIGETTREIEDIRQAMAAHHSHVAEHIHQLETHILRLQQSLREAAWDMQDVQSDLDSLENAVRSHHRQLNRRVEVTDLALLSMIDASREVESELDALSEQVLRQNKAFSRVYGEVGTENERLSQELNTIVAEVAQANEVTTAHIRSLEAELAALRGS
ncbi:MAG: hypothetical protein SNJ67_11530 [Chloracidobacterium sp.]|uniref:Uncharacterized protein n=1 Tax=Chloracidobacterium validum TaxID=2821543 RepID=A0ABX8B9U1_9BACT|nr:hypothetical protein [Chloracidobacterium validum]QUW03698.1 hypothetical protein J8C06_04495 [Chloracidobacterium validum]